MPFRRIAFLLACLTLALAGPEARGQLSGIEQARLDSIRRPYTTADIQFMSGMIHHHAQAVKMARWCPTHGASRSVALLCRRIDVGQTAEIELMQQWLRERNQPVPDADPRGMKHMMNGVEHFMLMKGMLTEAEIARLDSARGTDFDRLFLASMIKHHDGAVSMVDSLFNTPGAGNDEIVFKFANGVQVDQKTEIARMQQMLQALPGAKDQGPRTGSRPPAPSP